MPNKATESEIVRLKLTGLQVKEERENKGWPQEKLASRIMDITGIRLTKHAVSKWEREKENEIKAEPWNINALHLLLFQEEKISYDLFTKYVGKFSQIEDSVKVVGKYKSIWGFDNELNPEILEFSMDDRIVIGKVSKGSIDYELYGFLFANHILSGFWVNKNDGHHGNVMLQFTYGYKKALGNWVGTYDRPNKNQIEIFKYGHWRLEKI